MRIKTSRPGTLQSDAGRFFRESATDFTKVRTVFSKVLTVFPVRPSRNPLLRKKRQQGDDGHPLLPAAIAKIIQKRLKSKFRLTSVNNRKPQHYRPAPHPVTRRRRSPQNRRHRRKGVTNGHRRHIRSTPPAPSKHRRQRGRARREAY